MSILRYVSIRQAEVHDLKQVYEIETKSFRENAYPFNIFLFYFTISKDLFLVADYLGRVVGYVIGLVEYKDGKKLGHIISLAVDPLYRGIGIGRKLMESIERLFAEKKVDLVYLEVNVNNLPAINLYKKLGYTIAGLIPKYYGREDAYIMVKKIRINNSRSYISQ